MKSRRSHGPKTNPALKTSNADARADFMDKTLESALVLVLTKLLAGWGLAYYWSIPMLSRVRWGFVPFVGLETTTNQFRQLVAASTITVIAISAIWALSHSRLTTWARPGKAWGALTALPMAGLLVAFERLRVVEATPLLANFWFVQLLTITAASAALFLASVPKRVAPVVPRSRVATGLLAPGSVSGSTRAGST